MPPKKEIKYQKLSNRDHCLTRIDTYLNSAEPRETQEFIAEISLETKRYVIKRKSIVFSPAILRVFLEILYNAVDNYQRSLDMGLRMNKLVVSIDRETGMTSIMNNGYAIPIEINQEHGVYHHSLVFGELLSGSNFDDTQDRTISGRNGIGASAVNVFSTYFEVEGVDPVNKKKLVQVWTNNMGDTTGPKVTSSSLKTGYTRVTYQPDFEKLGHSGGYTNDIIQLYTRYVIDSAMLTGINVVLNEDVISIKKLKDYVEMFEDRVCTNDNDTSDDTNENDTNTSSNSEVCYVTTDTCKVALMPCNEYQVLSFVNRLYTKNGGTHVDAWSEALFRPIVDKFNKDKDKGKTKTPKITISDVQRFFRLIVVCTVSNPKFDSQSKESLVSPKVIAEVKKSSISGILKWSVIQNIENIVKNKELTVLKKIERKRGSRPRVEGLDSANNSGGKNSTMCTLAICEGDSAKTTIVAGIQKGLFGRKGRDWFGILALRGKILNVRNATPKTISENKVIQKIIQTLNIKHDVDYTDDKNFKTLDYGTLMCATDQDYDGFHIEGLLMNLFHYLFPSILQRSEPFFISMKTPIARVIRPKMTDMIFYDELNYKDWLESNNKKKYKVKYYKGLGTIKPSDVKDVFGEKMVKYVPDQNMNDNMVKVFHKKYSDMRKDWLGIYDPNNVTLCLDKMDKVSKVTFSDFINNVFIQFSYADCARNIPNLIDGQKECQRQILYCAKKRKLKYTGNTLKVAQLGGYTAEHANYHHGEDNLYDAICGMAQDYPGKNNITLLYPEGQFGSRDFLGKDVAAPRYIYTKMDMLTELIYREEDEPLLRPVISDGDKVQPEFYVPIIPMILVNGCFDPNTIIPLYYHDTRKLAKDIQVGDVLIGDDNKPRKVLTTCTGTDLMYKVSQSNGIEYVVNSKHTLSLVMVSNAVIVEKKHVKNCFHLIWIKTRFEEYDGVEIEEFKYDNVNTTGERALRACVSVMNQVKCDKPRVIHITVEEYLKLPFQLGKGLYGYKAGDVTGLSDLTVSYSHTGVYHGWQVDGNQRFVLSDATVVHNCHCAIGTGWSCSIPNYNPIDVIAGIRAWLENDGVMYGVDSDTGNEYSLYPEFIPWYRGFTGPITPVNESKFITHGVISGEGVVEITELPIGMSTESFKEYCEELLSNKKIAGFKNYSDVNKVHFIIQEYEDGMECDLKTLKLHSYLHTSNMVLFDDQSKLAQYHSIDEIMDKFCEIRYEYYKLRKQYQIKRIEYDLDLNRNKERFIKEVKDGTLKLVDPDTEIEEKDLINLLEKRGYTKISKFDNYSDTNEEDQDTNDNTSKSSGYEYLLRLQVRTFTLNNLNKLRREIEDLENRLDNLRNTSEKQLWLNDLDEFEAAYEKWLVLVEERSPSNSDKNGRTVVVNKKFNKRK